jgi:hypothetical protein
MPFAASRSALLFFLPLVDFFCAFLENADQDLPPWAFANTFIMNSEANRHLTCVIEWMAHNNHVFELMIELAVL